MFGATLVRRPPVIRGSIYRVWPDPMGSGDARSVCSGFGLRPSFPPCACQRASLLSSNAFSCAQAGVPLLLLPHVSPGARRRTGGAHSSLSTPAHTGRSTHHLQEQHTTWRGRGPVSTARSMMQRSRHTAVYSQLTLFCGLGFRLTDGGRSHAACGVQGCNAV